MTFDSIDSVVEMHVGGWVDISDDVIVRDSVHVTRGRQDEAASISPATCQLELDNTTGNYSPRNPTGAYYGTLGRNTPVRVAIRTEKDSFTRTVSNGWGTSDTAGAWSTFGGGGTVAAGNWNVAGGVGTHSVPAVAAYRVSYLPGRTYQDVDVAATVSGLPADVTGAAIEPLCLILGGVSTADHFIGNIGISATEVVTAAVTHFDGTVLATPVTVPITYTGQALRARFQLEGNTLRLKVWDAATAEPYAWNIEIAATAVLAARLVNRAAGWVGIRSGVASGNTNAKPVVFSYDNVEVRSNRFAGEVSAWPVEWDLNGEDVSCSITASGPLRRLGQGQAPLHSTLYRGTTTMNPPPLAYWPAEDGTDSTEIAAAVGGRPMRIDGGEMRFAANNDFACSDAIPTPAKAMWYGPIEGAVSTGTAQVTFLLSVPADGEISEACLLRVNLTGSACYWDLSYTTGGGLRLRAYDVLLANLLTSVDMTFAFNGEPVQISVELVQDGADIDWAVVVLRPGAVSANVSSGTLTSRTVGALTGVMIDPYHEVEKSAVGHIMCRNYYGSLYALEPQLRAYDGEQASARIARLCQENGVGFTAVWDGTQTSTPMGPQRPDTLLDLINQCVTADMGSLYEGRSHAGLVYRLRSSAYNQTATLAMDFATLSPPYTPVDDDQALRNDVTAKRDGGSSYRAIQLTGPLAVSDPTSTTGVGRYDTSVDVNVQLDAQLPQIAGWLLHQGTVDEERYPTIRVDLTPNDPTVSIADRLTAMAVDVDDRVTITDPAVATLPRGAVSQLVRGYTESWDAVTHEILLNCSPASPYDVMVLNSSSMGKLDTDTSVLVTGLTTTGTSLLVADAPGPGWTSDPAEMPIPITVGGETMTVTAISAIAPSFVSAGAAVTGNNTSLTPGLPAGAVARDLLLIWVSIRNLGPGNPAPPAGYEILADSSNGRLFGKIHSGSEVAPTVSFTGGVANATTIGQMAAFRGVSTTVMNKNFRGNFTPAQNIAYNALSVTGRNALILYLGWKQDDWTSTATLAGATEIGETTSTLGDDASLVWDYQIQTDPADIAAGSFTVTGGANASSTGSVVALAPAIFQTMTVTRSVNGVVKTHAAGEPVRLARPATLAL